MAKLSEVMETITTPVCIADAMVEPGGTLAAVLAMRDVERAAVVRRVLLPRHQGPGLDMRVEVGCSILVDWVPATIFSDGLCLGCARPEPASQIVNQFILRPSEQLRVLLRSRLGCVQHAQPVVVATYRRRVDGNGSPPWHHIDLVAVGTAPPLRCARCQRDLAGVGQPDTEYARGYADGVLALMPEAERQERVLEAARMLGEKL